MTCNMKSFNQFLNEGSFFVDYKPPTLRERVISRWLDIEMEERKISEKSYTAIDELRAEMKQVEEKFSETIDAIIERLSGSRVQRIAEEVYSKITSSTMENSIVGVVDMATKAKSHVDEIKNALEVASSELYELKKMGDEVKLEFPKVTAQLHGIVEPLMEKIEGEIEKEVSKILTVFR